MCSSIGNTALFTKTCEKDYKWLELLAKTIDKFANGFCAWYVIFDEGSNPPPVKTNNIPLKFLSAPAPKHLTAPCPFAGHPGLNPVHYNYQQVVKMTWPDYTDKDVDSVIIIDSDMFLCDYFSPQSMCCMDRPVVVRHEWDDESKRYWFHPIKNFIGPAYDKYDKFHYMNTATYIVTRHITNLFHKFCKNRHNCSFYEYAMNHYCTEYNFLGAFIDSICKNDSNYVILNREQSKHHKTKVRTNWSWGGEQTFNKARLETERLTN